ncbi:hypothetical protein BD289DRAFT_369508 [Coniella lustricola]|uniref:F-box domain-containing protein n=1 Tax=Coniella lustricola TaxID=2025994 RepID=A0A2T3A6E4_9PEZI|nr:hypothetical protein BD289DRAFT_369508 [Coniella lustricola]
MRPDIPQEIWWLVCQELQEQRDRQSLLSAALVCESWAQHALPLLYSIHDASVSDETYTTIDNGKYKWAGLWRSIILSSIGVTQFPYCLWLKSLYLSDLEQLLRDVAISATLRPKFFEGRMADFEILSRSSKTRAGKPILEWQKIIEQVGDSITSFAKHAADKENKAVQLTILEGANLPTQLLSVWTSRLSTLTTLTIRDGSVLTEEVATSIRDNCPAFNDLTCFNIRGQTVDENMSAFFRTLRPNSLESFAVLSSNEIGYNTLDGLMQHSESLRNLTLSSLQSSNLPFLHLLSRCKYLEQLTIEPSTPSSPNVWAPGDNDPLLELSTWLKDCKYLHQLVIKDLGGASKLLAEVLKSPDLRLKGLTVKLIDDDVNFYTAIGRQADLESLAFRSTADVSDPIELRHDLFMDSICACGKLKELDTMLLEQVPLTCDDLCQISERLPNIESLSFDGECECHPSMYLRLQVFASLGSAFVRFQ